MAKYEYRLSFPATIMLSATNIHAAKQLVQDHLNWMGQLGTLDLDGTEAVIYVDVDHNGEVEFPTLEDTIPLEQTR